MDEIQHERMCEDAAFGEWLIETIANSIGVNPDPSLIDRAVYRGTDCGAWVRFDEKGIQAGSIVEGSDAEFAEHVDLSGIESDDDGAALLVERFWLLVERINNLACEAWEEANGEDNWRKSPDDEWDVED